MFHIAGVAVIDCDLTGHVRNGVEVVSNLSNVADYVCREWVDEVFVNLPEDVPYPGQLLNQLTEMGVVVHMKLAKTSGLVGERKADCGHFGRSGRMRDHSNSFCDPGTDDLHSVSGTNLFLPDTSGKKR